MKSLIYLTVAACGLFAVQQANAQTAFADPIDPGTTGWQYTVPSDAPDPTCELSTTPGFEELSYNPAGDPFQFTSSEEIEITVLAVNSPGTYVQVDYGANLVGTNEGTVNASGQNYPLDYWASDASISNATYNSVDLSAIDSSVDFTPTIATVTNSATNVVSVDHDAAFASGAATEEALAYTLTLSNPRFSLTNQLQTLTKDAVYRVSAIVTCYQDGS